MQEELRLVYAELHAVAHNKGSTIASLEAKWVEGIGRTRLSLRGPLRLMTEQMVKELKHQPLKVTDLLSKQQSLWCCLQELMCVVMR